MTTAYSLLSWLFFMSFTSFTLLNYVVVVSGQCLSHQQSLLLQLKDTLIFNETRSKILVKWNQISDCCTWEGVTCEEGLVTGLNLCSESISGGINENSSLWSLVHLKSLNLSLNSDLNSAIPSRIGNLTNLRYLDFSNSFSGEVPQAISRLSKLCILDLSEPVGLSSADVSILVKNLTGLEELYLDGVSTFAAGDPLGEKWGQALSSWLSNLRVISMSNSELFAFPQSLAKLQNLSVIRLEGNMLDSVPRFLGNLSKLTTLQLSDNMLTGMFPIEIFQIPTLRILDISENGMLGSLLAEFPSNSFLQVLDTSHTNFGGRLPYSIGNLRHLAYLDLSFSSFHGSIPNSIANLTQLVHFDLSHNHFFGSIPTFNMSNNYQLTEIDLSENQFNGPIPPFSKCRNLTEIVLSNNQLSGPIPSFNKCRNLARIDFFDNQLSGPIPSFNECRDLAEIYLINNQLSGPIPSFKECRMLTEISLSFNQLSGPIPSDYFEGLPNLIEVGLKNNFFDGIIPSSMFGLPHLRKIDLSHNKFTKLVEFSNAPFSNLIVIDLSSNKLRGPIPLSIFKLELLYSLSLSSNKFNGTIHLNMFQGLSQLSYLDLSYNNLSVNGSGNGSNISIFPELSYLRLASCNLQRFPDIIKNQIPKLNYLDLSDNHIDGEIPNWIWKLDGSAYLNLSHNHLVGNQKPYPLCSLFVLDLSFNELHGKVPILPPDIFYVDLSSNSFTSSIPSDIGKNLTQTTFFSIANNSLVGVIPESICNARDLQVLDLSRNSLKGLMPACLFASNRTIVINLRKNKLTGPIPDVFPANSSLKILDLNSNLLSERIPKSLANCNVLEELDLGNNQMLDKFPKLLKNISTLRVLVLKSNKFYGQIACTESIGDWPLIQIVDVASNSFSGELPGRCLTKWHTMVTVISHGKSQLWNMSDYYLTAEDTTERRVQQYEVAVSVTNKGLEMELLKIVSYGFTYIDFSSNWFHGQIPSELGQLICLHGLNLSNNVLSGHIPWSLGNMRQLESLDLSRNHLSGIIPPSLSNLNFLGFLNLSYNQLHGRIPTGGQIQTFSADRFQGNRGLCGLPMTPGCPGDTMLPETPNNKANHSNTSGSKEVEWNLISVEIGFIVGFGGVVGPLVFCKRWREKYYNRVEGIAYRMLPLALLRMWLIWMMGSTRRRM